MGPTSTPAMQALPTQPAAPPMLAAQSPQGTKPKQKGPQASFLGAADIANPISPSATGGGKTLLGQ